MLEGVVKASRIGGLMHRSNLEKQMLVFFALVGAGFFFYGCSARGDVAIGIKLRIVNKTTGAPVQGAKVELVRLHDGFVCQTGKTGADGVWEKTEAFPFHGQPGNCDVSGCILKVYSPSGKVQSITLSNAEIRDFRIEREIAIER
jgi:hypothetical protein